MNVLWRYEVFHGIVMTWGGNGNGGYVQMILYSMIVQDQDLWVDLFLSSHFGKKWLHPLSWNIQIITFGEFLWCRRGRHYRSFFTLMNHDTLLFIPIALLEYDVLYYGSTTSSLEFLMNQRILNMLYLKFYLYILCDGTAGYHRVEDESEY